MQKDARMLGYVSQVVSFAVEGHSVGGCYDLADSCWLAAYEHFASDNGGIRCSTRQSGCLRDEFVDPHGMAL
jgi:hypothetical protein